MTFYFNPSLWFVCKLCRESFPDTDRLKAHKLESHLGESLNIKCIVFEEKLLDHEWIPPSQEFSFKPYQLIHANDAPPQESNDDPTNFQAQVALESHKSSKFKNPYVSLKVLTAQELNPASATAFGTTNIGDAKSTLGSIYNLQFKEENRKFLTKQKLNSVPPSCPFPSKQFKPDDRDEDDAHKNKIRELLCNAVIIPSEQNNASNNQVVLESQDLPISIVSTYSIPSSSNSNVINSVNKSVSFNSLQQQQNQLALRGNGEGFVQNPLTTFDVANSPFVPQILPTFVMQPGPEQTYSYPIILNDNGQPIGVQGDTESDNLNIFDATLPAGPGITSVTNIFTGKVEVIECDSIAQYPKIEMISSLDTLEEPEQILHENSDLSLPLLESPSTSTPCLSNKKMQKRYICAICSAVFSRSCHLIQHRLTHSDYRFPCPKCVSKFKAKISLERHLIAVHGQASDFRCHVCNKFFPSKSYLALHGSSHSDERPCHCDFPNCGAQFKNTNTLYVHTRMKHGRTLGFEQFECPTCGATYGLKKYLTEHQKRAHYNSSVQILS